MSSIITTNWKSEWLIDLIEGSIRYTESPDIFSPFVMTLPLSACHRTLTLTAERIRKLAQTSQANALSQPSVHRR
jgi:hypothetical protein